VRVHISTKVMSGLSLGTRVTNLKSVALTVLQLFAFNARFNGLVDCFAAHSRNTHRHTHICTERLNALLTPSAWVNI